MIIRKHCPSEDLPRYYFSEPGELGLLEGYEGEVGHGEELSDRSEHLSAPLAAPGGGDRAAHSAAAAVGRLSSEW